MSSTSPSPPPTRVAAVLVVHNGEEWLPRVLRSLQATRHRALEVVAVNSGSSDDSAAILARELPQERILTLERNQGFGTAVTAALATEAVRGAEHVLLLHDDLLLDPGAIPALVAALAADPAVGVVGPKLRVWGHQRLLQEVGLTIDRLGRVEPSLEPGELDQGQHDSQREVLFVSSAGMLVRRDVLEGIGGFDQRYPVFRDDLDLCWRIWLAGHRVEVVPTAVGYHVAAASRRLRPVGRGKSWDARYFAERHTIATLLKNYGALRLLWVLPLLLLVGLGKVLGFLLTRRFGDALATGRAYLWNVVQLPTTLRLRREVKRQRAVADADIVPLLAPGLPRVRSYAEAMGSWLAGGGTRALIDDSSRARRVDRSWRARPVVLCGLVLLAAYLFGVAGLLGEGQLVGGEVAPWPAAAGDFWRAYASPWSGDPLGSESFSSPFQVVLGLLSLLGFGSAWLAQRLVVLGLIPLAWMLAVRAGRMLTVRPGPRVVGATLYVISPVVLGALGEGRLGALVVAALLPGLVLVGVRTVDPDAGPAGWRAAALLALGLIVAAGAAPSLLPLLGLLWLVLLLTALARLRRGGSAVLRVLVGGALALLVLGPWLLELADGAWASVSAPVQALDLPLWRALALAPVTPVDLGLRGAAAVLLTSATVAAAALLLGVRRRPEVVAVLLACWAASSLAAWAVAADPVTGIWAPALLLPADLARAGLGVLAARWLLDVVGTLSFGVRQLAYATVAAVLVVGAAGGVLRLSAGPGEGLQRDPTLLPAFVGAEPERVGPYRVVLLEEAEGVVRWDVTDAGGPTMVEFGAVPDDAVEQLIARAVATTVAGVEPTGGVDLGLANVRYLVVAEGAASPDLVAAINRQPALEPLPAGSVNIWRVRAWLPRAAVLPAGPAEALLTGGDPGDTEAFEEGGLERTAPDRFAGEVGEDGALVVLAESAASDWTAVADGQRTLAPVDLGEVQGFRLQPGDEQVVLRLDGEGLHRLLIAWQGLVLLGIASLVLRPPGSRQRRTAAAAAVPGSLTAGPDLAPARGPIVPPPLTDPARAPAVPQPDRDPAGGA